MIISPFTARRIPRLSPIEKAELALQAQWKARREVQARNWELVSPKNPELKADPRDVKIVANGCVKHAIEVLRKLRAEAKDN